MKPLFLEFKGLNSFSEKTQIDFTPLLKGGIFGIFGETGSGKSTILDAINFALFGDIGRSTIKTDKINDKCDSLEVKFTFDIFSEGRRRKYYVERSIKRKSGTHKAMLYELPEDGNGTGTCLKDSVKSVDEKIVEIIGINEEDFKKCIALPQGEFSQFVKSAPSERTELIERLFSLQKYGENLKLKLSRRKISKEGEFNTLNGKLSAYKNVTAENLKELKSGLNSLKESEKILKKQAEEASAAYDTQKKLYEDKKVYLVALKNFETLKADKPYYDGLGKALPSLPYCFTAIEKEEEIASLDVKLKTCENRKEEIAESISLCEERKLKLTEQITKSDYEGEYRKLNELYGKMCGMLPDSDKLQQNEEELALCRKKYKQRLAELSRIKESAENLKNKSAGLKAVLESTPEPDIAEYFGTRLKGSILKDEYAKNLCYIKDLQDGVNFFADGSALYDYITKELNAKAEEYKQLILLVKDEKIDIDGQLQLFTENLKKHRKAENDVNKCQSELNTVLQNQINMQELVSEVLAEGERIKREYDELTEKLKAVFGEEKDFRGCALKVQKQAQAVKLQQKNDEEQLKKTEGKISSYQAESAAVSQAIESAKESKTAAQKLLTDSLKNAEAVNTEECKSKIAKYGKYSQAIEKYNKYNADYAAVQSQVLALEKKCEGCNVDVDIVKAAEENKKKTEKDYSDAVEQRAVKESQIKDFTEKLEEKKQLDSELEKINSERNLIAQLDRLLRDNKFMKYIANEHLENISHAASKTLLELTDGRYFLNYREDNFCVGDNYNGGNTRKVNTLSGGETFLVSLSLSLALSDTICRRSLKSIEFFFLDEGFGTLDGDLIDTVLDALEKLKSSDFTIGLISHVEELKHRINNKILVSKATESHGSSVKISC